MNSTQIGIWSPFFTTPIFLRMVRDPHAALHRQLHLSYNDARSFIYIRLLNFRFQSAQVILILKPQNLKGIWLTHHTHRRRDSTQNIGSPRHIYWSQVRYANHSSGLTRSDKRSGANVFPIATVCLLSNTLSCNNTWSCTSIDPDLAKFYSQLQL